MRASGGEWRLVESVGAVFSPTSDIARDICRAAESARWAALYTSGQERWAIELLDGYGQQVGMLPSPDPELAETLVAAGEMYVRRANRQRRLPVRAA